MMEPAELLGTAEEALRRALAAGAEAAEAWVEAGRGTHLKIEADRVVHASEGSDLGIAIRVRKGRRTGFAYCTDPADVPRIARDALAASAALAEASFAFPGPIRATEIGGLHDPRVARLTREEGAEEARLVLEAALSQQKDLTVPDGGFGWGEEAAAIANSEGLRAAWRGTHVGASCYAILRDRGVATGFDFAVSRALDVDPVAVGYGAAAMAMQSRGARAVAPGLATVVFAPTALGTLLECALVRTLAAESARTGHGPWSGLRGAQVLPEAYSLVDDGRLPGGLASAPVDDEGVPTRRTPLVERGVLRTFFHDLASADRAGEAPTGSAVRAERRGGEATFRAPPRAAGRNLVLEGPRVDDLVKDVRKGLLVHDALGAHTANPSSGDFSVAASVVFRIERGEVVGPGKPVLLSGNLPELLRNLDGVGKDERWLGGDFSPATLRLPSVRLPGVRVTTG